MRRRSLAAALGVGLLIAGATPGPAEAAVSSCSAAGYTASVTVTVNGINGTKVRWYVPTNEPGTTTLTLYGVNPPYGAVTWVATTATTLDKTTTSGFPIRGADWTFFHDNGDVSPPCQRRFST